jgi:hypothetical protein
MLGVAKLFGLISLLIAGTLSAANSVSASTNAEPTRMGTHGMLLFGGNDALFASHLPMFHTPHDVQLVLEIALTDAKLDRTLRGMLQAERAQWTLEPEVLSLSSLWQAAPAAFNARLVRGHFERGGRTVFASVQVRVKQVLYRQVLSPSPAHAKPVQYQIVQRGQSAFVFKRIVQRPDFDHILRIELHASTNGQALNGGLMTLSGAARIGPGRAPQLSCSLVCQGKQNKLVQPANSDLQQMLDAAGVRATVAETLYFETADLQ